MGHAETANVIAYGSENAFNRIFSPSTLPQKLSLLNGLRYDRTAGSSIKNVHKCAITYKIAQDVNQIGGLNLLFHQDNIETDEQHELVTEMAKTALSYLSGIPSGMERKSSHEINKCRTFSLLFQQATLWSIREQTTYPISHAIADLVPKERFAKKYFKDIYNSMDYASHTLGMKREEFLELYKRVLVETGVALNAHTDPLADDKLNALYAHIAGFRDPFKKELMNAVTGQIYVNDRNAQQE